MKYDVAVLGAGPGGYVAAIRAAQLGLKVCIIEKDNLGGICLNWGCIPTKALLRCSELNHTLHNLEQFGFSVKDIKFDFKKVIERSRAVSKQLSSGIAGLMKKNKIEVIKGVGKIIKSGTIIVNDKDKLEATNIIIATGARARVLQNFEPDGKLIWTYREAMTPTELPKTLCVIGSGAIGSEFASFYQNMGCKVTLLEAMDKILPVEDVEISKIVHKSFISQGMTIETGVKLESFEKQKDSVVVKYNGKSIEVERVIMAVGIVPNVENIGIENIKLQKLDKGHIKVDQFLETTEKGIYAIGDVTDGPWLAHKASHEGVIAAEKIASTLGKYDVKLLHPLKRDSIPGCTYTHPQVASFGLTEAKAKELKRDVKIGRFSPIGNGKSIAAGETEGLIKTIFDAKTGEILGVHMVGAEVTEMISAYLVGKTMEATELDFIHTIFPHPTMSEMLHESVLNAFGVGIHM